MTRQRARLPWILACLLAALPAGAARTPADTEAQLSRIQARIREVTEAVQGDVARRDGVAAELRSADQALVAARRSLEDVRGRNATSQQRQTQLRAEQARTTKALAEERSALAGQLRAAYLGGHEQELRVLLNDMLAYYGYLGRARAARIAAIHEHVAELEAVEQALAAETAQLAKLAQEQQRQAQALDAARADRQRALGALQARIAGRNGELKDLRANAASLEDLLTRLRAALEEESGEDAPGPASARRPFPELRGKLAWPAHGKLAAQFGEVRAGGLRWNGLLLDTHSGGEVRAPYFGRVVYSDWLPGLGLLLILDHGNGFLSLYGYNERLHRSVGERVRPGDLLAQSYAAGDGAGRPQLYVEIREGARPLDPRQWLRGAPKP
ncbi:MAG: peptidoglycan DD-metalloendopeptidase family protein [Proteobacteria bacterium]|nr:peptidoglycan DD-metalloendopeptidase family protein [Pseudomonadota bacterium]